MAKTETAALDFGSVPAGSYCLAYAITAKRDEARPYIRLGAELPEVEGWWVPGRIEVRPPSAR